MYSLNGMIACVKLKKTMVDVQVTGHQLDTFYGLSKRIADGMTSVFVDRNSFCFVHLRSGFIYAQSKLET